MTKKRILIVDDEPDIVKMLELRLQVMGYETLVARDGQEGLELAKKEMPDLMILDIMMPKLDGFKVCGLLKADTRFKNIPIVMFTARGQEMDRDISKDIGADAYLNKPLNATELKDTIGKFLGEGL